MLLKQKQQSLEALLELQPSSPCLLEVVKLCQKALLCAGNFLFLNIIRSCVAAAFSSEIVFKNLFARMESKYQFPKWLRKSFPEVYFLATAN